MKNQTFVKNENTNLKEILSTNEEKNETKENKPSLEFNKKRTNSTDSERYKLTITKENLKNQKKNILKNLLDSPVLNKTTDKKVKNYTNQKINEINYSIQGEKNENFNYQNQNIIQLNINNIERRQYTFGKEEDLNIKNSIDNNESNNNFDDSLNEEIFENNNNNNDNNNNNLIDEKFRKIIINKLKNLSEAKLKENSLENTSLNLINTEIKKNIKKIFIDKEKNTNKNSNYTISGTNSNTILSTNSKTIKINMKNESNKNVSEFKIYETQKKEENKNINKYLIMENNFIKIIDINIWLTEIGLNKYKTNFIRNNIYCINNLIIKLRCFDLEEKYEYINKIIEINKSGYIFRILTKLDIDYGLIDKQITDFLFKNFIPNIKDLNNYNDNDLSGLSVSKEYTFQNCCHCKNNNNKTNKNDLNYFLDRYELNNYKNYFYNNGFNNIEFLLLQMYSTYPINYLILEKYMGITDEKIKYNIVNSLQKEIKKINYFLNSEEYLKYKKKHEVNYQNILFENSDKSFISKIHINNKNKDNDKFCLLF